MAVGVLDPRKGIVWQDSGSSLTPEQIEQLQALEIRKRMGGVDTSPVNHWTQGAARVVDALGGVLRERRLNNAASENQAYNAEQSAPLIEALSGASSPMASAPTSGIAQEMASTSPAPNVAPEIASGIVETASALGIDPVDLGTAISYETAGTFDPTKAGPKTQWGQHKGLIQFGEPQAKQYGVDWNNPVGSQLGANGAVANYLRSTGVKPGMGMMDIYSAINAGRVGRYGASDANNGGAPGTVADKVNQQMAGHRAKAMALLGDNGNPGSMSPERATSYSSRLGTPYQPAQAAIEQAAPSGYVDPMVSVQPQAMAPEQAGFDASRFGGAPAPIAGAPEIYSAQTDFAPELPAPVNVAPAPAVAAVQQPATQPAQLPQAPSANTAAIAQALRVMADPRANEGTRRVAQALLQQEQQKQQFAQEQSVWQQRQQYEQQQQNSDPLRQLQIQEAQIKLRQMQDPNSNTPDAVRSLRLRAQEAGLQPGTQEYQNFFITQGVRPPSNIAAPPVGYRYEFDENQNPISLSPIPGSKAAVEEDQRAKALGKQEGQRETATDVVVNAGVRALNAKAGDGGVLPTTGLLGRAASYIPESNSAEMRRQVGVLKANASASSIQAMRESSPTGAALGGVSDKDIELLANKAGTLDPESPYFERDLKDYVRTQLEVIHGPQEGKRLFSGISWSGKTEDPNAVQTDIPGVTIRRKN